MVRPTITLVSALLATAPVMAIPRHRWWRHTTTTDVEDATATSTATSAATLAATTTYAPSTPTSVQDYDENQDDEEDDNEEDDNEEDDNEEDNSEEDDNGEDDSEDDDSEDDDSEDDDNEDDSVDDNSSEPAAPSASVVETSASAPAATASSVPTSFMPGVGFQIVIQDPPVVPPAGSPFSPAEATVWDVDLFHASANRSLIPALKAHGKTVICYFNAGAVQDTDLDLADWPCSDPSLVGNTLEIGPSGDEFQGEAYVNVAEPTVVTLMQKRVLLAQELGCDGVDPDNVDAWEINGEDFTGFGNTKEDYVSFMSALSETAHGGGMMIGLKNAPEIADTLRGTVDFAILESCLENGDESEAFCEMYQDYIAEGKPVFDIAYPASAGTADGVDDADLQLYCDTVNGNQGFTRIMKLDGNSEGLNGWTQYCDGQGVFETKCE